MAKFGNAFDRRRYRKRLNGHWCLYCGMVATTEDHFPPISYSLRGFLLPACSECNTFAGTSYPTNLAKRIEYVKERLKKKYRKILRMPVWTQDELNEMGYGLKTGIDQCQRNRRTAHGRIAWNAESYLASIDRNSDFVQMNAECGITTD